MLPCWRCMTISSYSVISLSSPQTHTHNPYIIIHIHKTAGHTSTSPYVLDVNLQVFMLPTEKKKRKLGALWPRSQQRSTAPLNDWLCLSVPYFLYHWWPCNQTRFVCVKQFLIMLQKGAPAITVPQPDSAMQVLLSRAQETQVSLSLLLAHMCTHVCLLKVKQQILSNMFCYKINVRVKMIKRFKENML